MSKENCIIKLKNLLTANSLQGNTLYLYYDN